MTTDALTAAEAAAVLDEAEAIVRAEWMRLQHDDAPPEQARGAVSEMPAARPRPLRITQTTTTITRSWPSTPRPRVGWPPRRGPQRGIWPTQRSPPPPSGVVPTNVQQPEVMP